MGKEFVVNYGSAIAQFERAIQKFKLKNIIYKTLFRGKGLEFETYRDFGQDEDASMIDWKASLRGNKLLAKQYIEERDMDVYFLVDVSNSMLFGSGNKLKSEYSAEVAAAMAKLVYNSDNKISLIMFNQDIVEFLRPAKTKNQFWIFTDFLKDAKRYGGKFNLGKVIDYLLKTVKSNFSMFIIISDFVNLGKDCEDKLKLLGSKFETMALAVRDPFDEELPKGNYHMVLQDPYSNRQMVVDSSITAKKYRENVIKQKKKLDHIFEHSNIDHTYLDTSKNFVVPLVKFLNSRIKGRE